MKILVRNLSRDTIEHDVRKLFLDYGRVTECTLVLDKETGTSKGFAFVTMPNVEEAKVAIKELNLTMFAGNKIRVKFAGH
ncbi:RNA recognition motif domain-containing protein [Vibrio hangzhouensis]|uniref:RNA recognition motif. (A.k.a. RRM, RBD, or RNP domain) n=1 Tax=Vibrio hangzhouensis TaxID=462991 RepID=A0A1H5Y2X6_9VIBR|nr:RNA-binding protein [Vibrio hangzhouensis]SEG18273.1 RNA recognition motif. (a.k.a. RRM, RBD, or RNP domain) [Vibrio hangzhouensis]